MKQSKKLETMQFLLRVGGGITKEWKTSIMVLLATFAGSSNLINLFIKSHTVSDIFTVILWFVIAIGFLILKDKGFYTFMLCACLIMICTDEYGYRGLSIFFLMLYVLSGNKTKMIVAFFIIFIFSMASYSTKGGNLIDTLSIVLQFVFATFCYYGFIFIRVKDINHKSKLIYTEEERKILHTIVTQDKTNKEIAYDLGLTTVELSTILNNIRRKNKLETTGMLLRIFAIEEYKESNS